MGLKKNEDENTDENEREKQNMRNSSEDEQRISVDDGPVLVLSNIIQANDLKLKDPKRLFMITTSIAPELVNAFYTNKEGKNY